MAIIRDPILFSTRFKVTAQAMAQLDLFDPTLNADTKLFIDPLLLKLSSHSVIAKDSVLAFNDYFGKILKLLKNSTQVGDKPWRSADELFTFKEPRETCLGYGDRTTHGSAIGPELRNRLMKTASEIIALGVEDPELFALMGLLEGRIGPDRISDMTTHAIKPALCAFNEQVVGKLGAKTALFKLDGKNFNLCRNPLEKEPTAVLLVPRDILRPLPVVSSWSDVADAASQNAALRKRVNDTIGNIWAIKTKKEKQAARQAVLSSPKALQSLLDTVTAAKKAPYDAKADLEGHYLWRAVLAEFGTLFPLKLAQPKAHTVQDLEKVADAIIEAFGDLIENKGQWVHLWYGKKPRHERAAQRLFFAVADVYCKANNLDVSPETNSGAGPVDFKFSSGYDARVLVEIKLSTGKVVHGYTTQIELYKKAEATFRARYLIIDVGGMGKKFQTINKMRNASIGAGKRVSPIIVVDGHQKKSASKA